MKHAILAGVVLTIIESFSLHAAAESGDEHRALGQPSQPAEWHRLHGVVNSVDAPAKRITITHDRVEGPNWPKMKINYPVQDVAMLQGVKAGQEIDFEIRKINEEYRVVRIVPAK